MREKSGARSPPSRTTDQQDGWGVFEYLVLDREQIENNDHIAALVAMKKQARHQRGQDRVATAVPASVQFLPKAIERGHRLGSTITELEAMLDQYHAAELEAALLEVIARDTALSPRGCGAGYQAQRNHRTTTLARAA